LMLMHVVYILLSYLAKTSLNPFTVLNELFCWKTNIVCCPSTL